ncbi:thaumatin-like protein 1 [Euphorbia lathyris]|uniref:thaumatin-like protein 1 n=1 Tax=Euphorbia lathyris TaxID=212925 RepID=UPI00331418D9
MALVFFALTFAFLFNGVHPATITFTNRCQQTVWPATLTGGGRPQLSTTGFELANGATRTVDVPAPFTGRFWARTECSTNSGRFTCLAGECGSGQIGCNGAGGNPPVTLIEFTLAENNGQDFYDISLVDGFNVPVSVSPQGGSGDTCITSSCAANVNAVCLPEFQVTGSNGVVACKSACAALNQPQYCCTGEFNSPETCKPTNYSEIFKNQCPQAYSYAYDDPSSTFSCTGGANYAITFCP